MYILNLKSGVVQECSNQDIIKTCKKNPAEYKVSEKKEDLKPSENANGTDISKMKAEELRKLAEEKGIEGAESLNKQELLKVLKEVSADD